MNRRTVPCRQARAYLWDYSDFLTDGDRRRIVRENTLGLLAPDLLAAGVR